MQLTESHYNKYKIFIRKLACSCYKRYYIKSRIDVDDLESEAWIALDKALQTFDKTKNIPFKGYAAHIIRNAIISYINVNLFQLKANYENVRKNEYEFKKLKNTKCTSINTDKDKLSEILQVPDKRGISPIENAEQLEASEILKIHINKLPPKQKIAIIKRFKDELTYEEIGKIIGVTKQQVQNLLENALKTLKEKFDGINI